MVAGNQKEVSYKEYQQQDGDVESYFCITKQVSISDRKRGYDRCDEAIKFSGFVLAVVCIPSLWRNSNIH